MFSTGNCLYSICIATSPFLTPYIICTWRPSNYILLLKFVAIFYAIAFSLRTIGRLLNIDYLEFVEQLNKTKSGQLTSSTLSALKQYDYQVHFAPVDFAASPIGTKWYASVSSELDVFVPRALYLIRKSVAWIASHSFGRRILYPGSTTLFHFFMNNQLIEGRRKLIEQKDGNRNIILTEDNNKLDTIFVDNRNKGENGDILIICCEGNAGFYECGVMQTPLSLQYSVLGWNMPGFGESGGTPYSKSILLAMEAIIQFAFRKLEFEPQQIVIYAWSIGGFPGTWAAANYNVRAIILDATFDDLMPLAIARMPSMLSGLVQYTIHEYFNLPISEQLNHYDGPVLMIRRWNDEIIVTNENSEEERRQSNRANWLLLKFIQNRYSGLLKTKEDENCIFEWLSKEPHVRLIDYEPEDSFEPTIPAINLSLLDTQQRHRLIRQLCTKYFVDFIDATHNMPLSPQYFNIPEQIK